MTDWKTIDSAPRDGARVIVWVPGLNQSFICEFLHGRWQTGVWSRDKHKGTPTHWMPLPDPPE